MWKMNKNLNEAAKLNVLMVFLSIYSKSNLVYSKIYHLNRYI